MTSFSFKPASEFSIHQVADLLTRGFEGYFVPIHITTAVLLTMMRRDSIDLAESRILHREDEPIGVALIARRGWTSRLAAMGIVSNARHGGAGTWAMQQLIDEAGTRGDKEMILEVIEQNTAGVKLYQKVGFQIVRRLVGYKLENPVGAENELQQMDIQELAGMVVQHGLKDLPWQLSGLTLAQHTPPSQAFRLNGACCLISNPQVEHISISSVLIKSDEAEAGPGAVLMRALFARFPNKVWHVPAIYPEEFSSFFDKLDMQREQISQWQMSLKF